VTIEGARRLLITVPTDPRWWEKITKGVLYPCKVGDTGDIAFKGVPLEFLSKEDRLPPGTDVRVFLDGAWFSCVSKAEYAASQKVKLGAQR